MRWLHKIEKTQLLFFFVLIFFGIEALNKIQNYYLDLNFDIQKCVKGISLIGILAYFLLQDKIKFFTLALFLVLFCVGQFFLPEAFTPLANIGFLRYFFFLSIILFFADINSVKEKEKVFSLFEAILWLNNTLIFIAILFGLEVFRSYAGERWGYNGLFMASSTSTYFYIIAIIYLIVKAPKVFFKKPLFWFTIAASFFIGTKSVYLAVLLIGLVLGFNFIKKPKLRLLVISLFGVSTLCLGYFFFSTPVFSEIISNEGWFTAILSYRDQLFIEDTLPYIQENWKSIHYFVGGLSNPFLRPQLELIDVWLYFGFLGMFFYLFIFAKHYFTFSLSFYEKCLLAVLFVVPLITGNFFYNASVPIYLVVLKLAFIKPQEKFLNSTEYP